MELNPLTLYGVFSTMRDWFQGATRKATDFTRGAVLRTLMEAISAPIEELYYRAYIVLPKKVFLALAKDPEDVVALVEDHTFGRVTRKSETTAAGKARFIGTAGASIPPSHQVVGMDNNVTYMTDSAAVIPPGETSVLVPVTALVSGKVGNLSPNRLMQQQSLLNGIIEVRTGPDGIGGGSDVEDLDKLKARVPLFFQNVTTGTPPAIEASAMKVPGVRTALYRGGWPAPLQWTCFIDAVGGASEALLAQVYNQIEADGHRDAEMLFYVDRASSTFVDMAITIRTGLMDDGSKAALKGRVELEVVDYCLSLSYGEDLYDDQPEGVITSLQDPNVRSSDVVFTGPPGSVEDLGNGRQRVRPANPGSVIRAGSIAIIFIEEA